MHTKFENHFLENWGVGVWVVDGRPSLPGPLTPICLTLHGFLALVSQAEKYLSEHIQVGEQNPLNPI